MNTRGFRPCRFAPGSACVLLFLCFRFASAAEPPLRVQHGFGGYVKSDRWFPVRVTPFAGGALDVYLMSCGYGCGEPEPRMHFAGVPEPDGRTGYALCRHSSRVWGAVQLRCEITRPDGSRVSRDVPLEALGDDDCLVLAVSERPEEFDFLGSIELPDRGVVRVVPVAPAEFPARWQELDPADAVILDGVAAAREAEQHRALRQWVTAGGTVLLTDRALRAGPTPGCWGLLAADLRDAPEGRAPGEALRPVLGKLAAHVEGVRLTDAAVPGHLRLLGHGGTTLVSGCDSGRGRVLLCGVDWRDPLLKDRSAYESLRQTLWARLLDFRRPTQRAELSTPLVLPREAKVDFLMKPLGLFLAVYVLLVGPVNWLVLRGLRRLEYSVFTIPAAAIVCALAAFLVGVALRTSEPVLHEVEMLTPADRGMGALSSVVGLLSPDRQPYTLRLPDPDAVLDVWRERYGFPERNGGPGLPVYGVGEGPWIARVRMATWSMRFFQTETVAEVGGRLDARARCGPDHLQGEVTNGLPFALRDAWVMYAWNRVGIGDLPAGARVEFRLPMALPGGEMRVRCPRCGRCHGGMSWYSSEHARRNPIPEELRRFLQHTSGGPYANRAFVVGWQEALGNRVQMDRAPFRSARQRLCFAPVELVFDRPEVFVPAGVAVRMESRSERRPLALGDLAQLRGRLSVLDVDALEARARGCRSRDPMAERAEERAERDEYEFLLPFDAEGVRTDALTVHWDLGEPDPDYSRTECVLSAYDWEGGTWREAARATEGARQTGLEDPDRFVRRPCPLVRLRIAPETREPRARYSVDSLELTYEGRRAARAGDSD